MTFIKKLPLFFLISFSFLVVFFSRLIWVYEFEYYEAFKFAGQFMVNTNDGYFWAEGARDLLSGISKRHDLSPINEALPWITYVSVKILPFSFETIIFYMSALIGSLIVVPVMLIAHNLKRNDVGILSAILSGIAVSYYNRTMIGYYDTDMMNILFPTLLLWSLILALRTKEEKYLLITGLEIIAYRWWYPQSYSLEFAYIGIIICYTLLYERKEKFNLQLIVLMLFAMMGLSGWIRSIFVIGLYGMFRYGISKRMVWILLGVGFILFLIAGGLEPIIYRLQLYIFQESVEASKDTLSLHFYSVMQTVREAGKIDFITFSERISGHVVTFIASLLGYCLMVWRYRSMILGLPLLGLGCLAMVGGLRFTIYAVPVCALGVSYLLFEVSSRLQSAFVNTFTGQLVKSSFVIIGSLAILWPNIIHIINYRVPTVFNKGEVEQLVTFGKTIDKEDYVVSWWDYGYPIRYYADSKTLIDGGKHSGDVNFPVSYMLTNSQESAARLARLEVEYTENAFVAIENNKTVMGNTAQMTLDYGYKDANDFLVSLQTPLSLPEKTREIYFYLPFRMLSIFPTVAQFSNLDIMTGKTVREPFYFETNQFKDSQKFLNLGNGIVLDKEQGALHLGKQQTVPVKSFVITSYDENGQFGKQEQIIHPDGTLNIIYMQSYGMFLVLDEGLFNSTFIQLFVLENIDKRFFEPINLNAFAKIYRLKI